MPTLRECEVVCEGERKRKRRRERVREAGRGWTVPWGLPFKFQTQPPVMDSNLIHCLQ